MANIVPQSIVNDTLGALLDVSISNLQNSQFLSYNTTSKMWNNSNISESNVTNLVSDLLSCEKSVNKNVANGYCPLDSNSLIPVNKIPSDIPENNITNLTNDLLNKADLISGYLKTSEIPLSVPLTINSLTTSNNIINLTTDNISQGTINKYAVYPIPISDISSFNISSPSTGQFLYYNGSQWINRNISKSNVSNLVNDLSNCEKK